jgi:hypothetical protein
MAESKILRALEEFKAMYAWDKSLIVPVDNSPTVRPPSDEVHANTSIEDFLNGSLNSR